MTAGTSDKFLITLEPEFKIMKSRERSNGNYQWLNTKSYGLPLLRSLLFIILNSGSNVNKNVSEVPAVMILENKKRRSAREKIN